MTQTRPGRMKSSDHADYLDSTKVNSRAFLMNIKRPCSPLFLRVLGAFGEPKWMLKYFTSAVLSVVDPVDAVVAIVSETRWLYKTGANILSWSSILNLNQKMRPSMSDNSMIKIWEPADVSKVQSISGKGGSESESFPCFGGRCFCVVEFIPLWLMNYIGWFQLGNHNNPELLSNSSSCLRSQRVYLEQPIIVHYK